MSNVTEVKELTRTDKNQSHPKTPKPQSIEKLFERHRYFNTFIINYIIIKFKMKFITKSLVIFLLMTI